MKKSLFKMLLCFSIIVLSGKSFSMIVTDGDLLEKLSYPSDLTENERFTKFSNYQKPGQWDYTLLSSLDSHPAIIQNKLISKMESVIKLFVMNEGATSGKITLQMEKDFFGYLVIQEGNVQLSNEKESEDLESFDMVRLIPNGQYTFKTLTNNAKVVLVKIKKGENDHVGKVSLKSNTIHFKDAKTLNEKGPLLKIAELRKYVEKFQRILSPKKLYLMAGNNKSLPPTKYHLKSPHLFSIAYARTVQNNGPALHVHRMTDEIFYVLKGRFKVYWGDSKERIKEEFLSPGDIVAFPPGVNRAFTGLDDDNILMPVIYGTDKELDDIIFLPEVKEQLSDVPKPVMKIAEKVIGVKFLPREKIDYPFLNETK